MKFGYIALGALLCASVYGADFSKKSESELINLAGLVKVDEYVDYQLEIAKRTKGKSEKDVKAFMDKLKAAQEKNTEKLTLKEWREYKKATSEAMKTRIEKMTLKELQESGLRPPHIKGGEGFPPPHFGGECGVGKKDKKDKKDSKK